MPDTHPDHAWTNARNILAVRLDAMGDLLMTAPAIRAVRQSRCNCRITLLTSPSGAAAAELIPEVDDVMVYEAPWMKSTEPSSDSGPDLAMIDQLRTAGFDAAAIFTVYSQNPLPAALFCYLAGIPRRLAHCRENPYQLLTDWVADPEPHKIVRHEVRRQLDLVSAVGCRADDERMNIRIPDPALRRVEEWLNAHGLDSSPGWLVIHPGSTAPSRRYPPDRFAEIARRLVRQHELRVVFTGAESERESDRGNPPGDGRGRVAVPVPGGGAQPRRAGRPALPGSTAAVEQYGPRARRRLGRNAGRRSVRAHQPAAHSLGRAPPRPEPRRPLQVLLQEYLPRRAPRLPAPGHSPITLSTAVWSCLTSESRGNQILSTADAHLIAGRSGRLSQCRPEPDARSKRNVHPGNQRGLS